MSKRSEKMKSQPTHNLPLIAKSGSLSSAAAEYEIKRREAKAKTK